MSTYHFVGSSGAILTQASVWSASQGGVGGAGVPGNLDTAIFDQTNVSQITVTAGQDFGTIQVTSSAKVKITATEIHQIGSILNAGLLTLAGEPIYFIDDNTHETAFGDRYFVVHEITNSGTLYSDADLILTGSVLLQDGVFGQTDYVWGTIPEGLAYNLFIKNPGGSLAPGNYGFRNVGQNHNLSLEIDTLDDDELVDFLLDGDVEITLEPDGQYGFFGFGGSGNDTYSATYTLDSASVYCTSFTVVSHGPQVILNALGTHFYISAHVVAVDVGVFLVGNAGDGLVFNWDHDTVVEIVPSLDPEVGYIVIIRGWVEFPRFVVNSGVWLALANPPVLALPRKVDSVLALPGSAVLMVDNGSGTIEITNDFTMQDATLLVQGPNSVLVGGDVVVSGAVVAFGDQEGPAASLDLDIEGDFTVTGTVRDPETWLAGDQYRRSYWNTGGAPFTQSTTLSIGGVAQVRDLEVYHVISDTEIVSPSSIGCWDVRFDIVSNCPGRREKQDNQGPETAHPISEITSTPHQGDRWHKTIQAQTGTRIPRSVPSAKAHASDMAWRKVRK